MTWKLDEFKHAGHTITVIFTPYNSKLKASISGPRSASIDKDRYANNIEWKIESRIPFIPPTAKKVDDKVYEIYTAARNEIDNAIAAHAKKHEDEYQ